MSETYSLFPSEEERVLSVGELTRWIQDVLEGELGRIQVEGEISGWKLHASSGHAYFALKDPEVDALIQCVIWSSTMRRLRVRPQSGMQVRCVGRVAVYPARGVYQLYVDRLDLRGEGELQAAFLELRRRLEAEGLFDPERKKPLPRFPKRIGVVTAPDGAALRDLVRVLGQRWPAAEVFLWPAQVQGVGAAESIARGIRTLDGLSAFDVLIVGRGGGSLEDLWAFNEEVVARAVADCGTPVVSAVGHEIDFTICDFVADVRAATPTHAAELVVPDLREVEARLHRDARALRTRLEERVRALRLRFLRLSKDRAFLRPETRVRNGRLDVDRLSDRLERALRRPTEEGRARLRGAAERLARSGVEIVLEKERGRLEGLRIRMERRQERLLESGRRRLELAGAGLRTLGPEGVLARGYGIVAFGDGRIVRDAADTSEGDEIRVTLSRGELECRVEARTLGQMERNDD
ncbi:MAG: exodeoxyribonuclease VII large subunit [Candidatus Eisenbacteria bacterium]